MAGGGDDFLTHFEPDFEYPLLHDQPHFLLEQVCCELAGMDWLEHWLTLEQVLARFSRVLSAGSARKNGCQPRG